MLSFYENRKDDGILQSSARASQIISSWVRWCPRCLRMLMWVCTWIFTCDPVFVLACDRDDYAPGSPAAGGCGCCLCRACGCSLVLSTASKVVLLIPDSNLCDNLYHLHSVISAKDTSSYMFFYIVINIIQVIGFPWIIAVYSDVMTSLVQYPAVFLWHYVSFILLEILLHCLITLFTRVGRTYITSPNLFSSISVDEADSAGR